MNGILRGTYKGKQYRLKVECYSKTPSIKVQLIPTDGSDRITVTQDIGQSLPRYQAYLVENILDVDSFDITDPDTGERFECTVGISEFLAPELQGRDLRKQNLQSIPMNLPWRCTSSSCSWGTPIRST